MKDTFLFLENLLENNDTIVIGVSGGPDSMCLLHILNSLKEKYKLNLICAHVNHGLRKESEEEAKFVQGYCEENNIKFKYMIIKNYHNNKFSEEEARRKRYNFFKETVKEEHAKYLMTAHHGNDLEETILMRIVRGSNLKGYIGIPRISVNEDYKIVRPLLNLNKKEILEYINEYGIKYVIDKSNEDEKYTRNRFRKHLLPFFEKENPNVCLKFLKFSEELENYYTYVNNVIENKLKDIYINDSILISKLKKEEIFIQEKIIEKVIEKLQKDYIFNISKQQFKEIFKLINSKTNKQINLADGFIVRISYDKLYIEKEQNVQDYNFELKDEVIVNNKYIIEKVKSSSDKSNNVIRLCSSELKLPLMIRNFKEGDKIKIKNLKGTKKVKDIFIDLKVDKIKRKEIPIVVDSQNEIIWLPGIKKSTFDKDISEKYDIILKCTEEKYE